MQLFRSKSQPQMSTVIHKMCLSLCSLQHTHTHTHTHTRTHTLTHTGLQVNHNALIRLGVFVVAQNATGANKAVQRLFIALHLGVYVCVCVSWLMCSLLLSLSVRPFCVPVHVYLCSFLCECACSFVFVSFLFPVCALPMSCVYSERTELTSLRQPNSSDNYVIT